jgi:N-acetylneuraminic acid mutarotase
MMPSRAARLLWLPALAYGAAWHAHGAPAPLADGAWSAAPPMRNARAAHAVVSTGTRIYALAGTGAGGRPVLEVERFDGTRWDAEGVLPGQGLNAPAAAVVDDRIVLIGGFDTTTNVPTAQVRIYDLRARQWRDAAPLPAPRGGHAAVVLGGKIHVLGGGNAVSTIADHSVYDPLTDTWRALAPLPRAEGSPAAVVWSGRIYAIGGRSGGSDFGDVYVYDPAADAWTSGPGIEPRGTAGAVTYCGAIHVFGGESQARSASLNGVLRLTRDGRRWEAIGDMPTARGFARAVLFGRSVYVVGGAPAAGSSHDSAGSNVVERFEAQCPP